MKTKNQDHNPENPRKLNSFMYLCFCLLLAGGFIPGIADAGESEAIVANSQAESNGQSGVRMNEERLHTQMSMNVLRLPTTSSGK